MSLTSRERETQRIYDERPYEWMNVSGGSDRPCFWKKEMDNLMMYLGKDKNVIELGCGPATDGKYLLEAGCKSVVSIDYSKGMLEMAAKILAGSPNKPILMEMDMYDLRFPDATFDGFWASASFLHLENPAEALKEVGRILKPGGFGFVSIKEGDGEEMSPKTGHYFHYFLKESNGSFGSIITSCEFSAIGPYIHEAPNHNWLTYLVLKPS